jgi:glycosyltransferase involved in cell wall biosynthesis
MRIAIFHQFLDNIGGAEVVTLTLARELKADVYTTNINKEKIKKMGFSSVLPRIKSIGKVPLKAPFRHQMALYRFRRLNLKDKYDYFIISGDWAVSGAYFNQPVLWYVHSPCRELWDLREYVRNDIVPFYQRPIYDLWTTFNRWLHPRYTKKIKKVVCNSRNTQNRLKKFLEIDAKVINPPIDCSKYRYKNHKNYWLSVNRFIAHKRIEIQLKAFEKLKNENLIIVGSYEKNARQFEEYKAYIEKIKPKNVKIINWVSDKDLKELYSECKGFITTAKDEDFGMTPVEAMASGKPVIAGNEGGYKETIINGKTGYLIDNINEEKLTEKIKMLSDELKNKKKRDKYKRDCMKRAKEFDTKKFIEKIMEEIKK